MKINGLPLPKLLIELIESNQWNIPNDSVALKEIIPFTDLEHLSFLDFEQIENESEAMAALCNDEYMAEAYGIYTNNNKPDNISDQLEIEKTLIIAIDYDEEIIALDYRANLEQPAIFISAPPNFINMRYVKITDSFMDFAKMIKLI